MQKKTNRFFSKGRLQWFFYGHRKHRPSEIIIKSAKAVGIVFLGGLAAATGEALAANTGMPAIQTAGIIAGSGLMASGFFYARRALGPLSSASVTSSGYKRFTASDAAPGYVSCAFNAESKSPRPVIKSYKKKTGSTFRP